MGAQHSCECNPTQSVEDINPEPVPDNDVNGQWKMLPPSEETDGKMLEDFDVPPVNQMADVAVYSWLNWSPKANTPCFETLQNCFPGALPGTTVVQRVAITLEKFGLTRDNTIFGHSFCPDEINNEKGGMVSSLTAYWGECFPMGGISGVPFVGKTGFAAFSHHVPADGHVLVFFGPHIGISESGDLGRVLRRGQCKHSTACGAVLAAYDACCKGGFKPGDVDKSDMQQSWLKQNISSHMQRIKADRQPLRELAHVAYELVEKSMLAMANNDFGPGKLVLVGGVQINMPRPFEDHFEPLHFQVVTRDSRVDLLPTFQFAPPRRVASQPFRDQCFELFSWLSWSPRPCTPCYGAMQRCFPGALPGQAVVRRSALVMERLGLTPANTIYGQSLCPDEVNGEFGGMAHSMAAHWGKCFPMGGIGGAPFVGRTGFAAFSHHVPDDGHVLVLFGPHIAISETGELGRILRRGQHAQSTACGAVLAAYDHCCRHGPCSGGAAPDPEDMQQSWLKEKIGARLPHIRGSDEPLCTLIHEAYGFVREAMLSVVNCDFGTGKLVLLGGIQINMPNGMKDHFQPLMFEARDSSGAREDLLPDLVQVQFGGVRKASLRG